MTQRHCQARVAWCRNCQRWTLQRGSQVAFSHEKFQCFREDSRERVYRRRYKRYKDACVCQGDRWGGKSAVIWAAISADHRSDLVFIDGQLNAVRYRDEILGPVVLHFLERVGGVFQHDNACPHVACVYTNFLMENDVHLLEWPAVSPNLDPIENVWDLGIRIRRHVKSPQNAFSVN